MTRTTRLACFALAILALGACRSVEDSRLAEPVDLSEKLGRAQRYQAGAAGPITSPDQTIADCEKFIAGFGSRQQPLEANQDQLEYIVHVLTKEYRIQPAAGNFPEVYEEDTRAVSSAYLTMALAYRQKGEHRWAERHANNAWAFARGRSVSPVWIAEQNVRCNEFLTELHEETGARGKAMIAQLYLDLSRDYLTSPQADGDRARDEQFYESADNIHSACNSVIRKVNGIRAERVRQQNKKDWQALAAGLSMAAQSASIQQAQYSGASQQQLLNLQMNQLQDAFQWGQVIRETDSELRAVNERLQAVGTYKRAAEIEKIFDTRRSSNGTAIVKDFCRKVREAVEDEDLAAESNAMIEAVDRIGGQDEEAKADSAAQFADEFSAYLSRVKGVKVDN